GVDYHAIGVQACDLAVKILKGEMPAYLAVEKPNTAAITVNEEMDKAVGIDAATIKA
ncbi:ABC transporter substrate binding protein, partial [Streptococcus suis]